MIKPTCLLVAVFLSINGVAAPQEVRKSFPVFVTGTGDALPVVNSLTQLLKRSKPFEVMEKETEETNARILVLCADRTPTEKFACSYMMSLIGPAFPSLFGSAIATGNSASQVSQYFLKAILQDVLERFDETNTNNLRQALFACLLMTESKCNAPEPLQSEFGKQTTLGQYLLKRGANK